jgi:hypothetical protein
MPTYKVSIVIPGGNHPGAIINMDERPLPGQQIQLEKKDFLIVEIQELLPPRNDFHFLHATCRPTEGTD